MPGRLFLLAAVCACAGASGCDRVQAWLALVRGEVRAPTANVSAGLGSYDCAPGLVRCVEGRVERSRGGAIDGLTLERAGCPFDLVDRCEGVCVDDEEHLEDGLPSLCLGDAAYRARHPLAPEDAGRDEEPHDLDDAAPERVQPARDGGEPPRRSGPALRGE